MTIDLFITSVTSSSDLLTFCIQNTWAEEWMIVKNTYAVKSSGIMSNYTIPAASITVLITDWSGSIQYA